MTTLWGILFPSSVLRSEWFAILSTFVAVNTVMYVVLAIVKLLPRVYVSDLFRGRNRRSETRNIDPDAPI
ncbi:hypothetical protein [Nocardioides sp. KR10-350]|uniref:hypothetical protein n=1 Tax=Nocardioides cheoyonin TaxID=3156615 RepID=UPI0032B5022E